MLEISLQRATAVRSAVQEVHGHARIPEDYRDHSQPGWIEAARWITRNARLFAKGKLSDTRYQLIRNILGEVPDKVLHVEPIDWSSRDH